MATPTATATAPETGDPGLRGTERVEWIKIVASASTTGQPVIYTFKKLKTVAGILGGGGFSVAIDNSAKTVTFTPIATITGTYIVGLVGK